MSHVSHKLSNSLEGALAGGGDPATSPLYVFGPFLKLIVIAGVAQVTFGASLWLVVFTILVVSAMYRQVMRWVTDGSGGSGLSEEEFGSWAVKLNASITFIEYTLTFLVSMAALVTFIADRFPLLNERLWLWQYRTFLAIGLSVFTGWLVNRGPKMAARFFGPATAAVLLLLWLMVGATLWQRGLQLPDFNLNAFRPDYLAFTLGGYARILAVMTGIEIFANLVAAYDGTPTFPVTVSLARHVRELSIPQAYFEELIKGVEMDLTTTRYATFDQLSLYCYRVASVVGLICLHVFGTTSPRAQDYAVNLGMAFQLTNILRDLGNDAECGRVYVPQEDLARFAYREEDLLHRRYKPEFTEFMRFEVGRAKEFYAKAARALDSLPRAERRALTVAEIMRGVYSRILHRIEQSGYRVLGDRVTLTPSHRLAVAAGVWLRSRLPSSTP